jgi:hypothetical protein
MPHCGRSFGEDWALAILRVRDGRGVKNRAAEQGHEQSAHNNE